MRRALFLLVLVAAPSVVGCRGRDERDAVSTTSLTSASLQPIALVGETKSGLRLNLEQSGAVDDASVAISGPAKLTLRRGERALAFRMDGAASKRIRGAFEFSDSVMLVTREALEDAYDGDPVRFVEAFGQTVYGDPERITPPAPTPDWNALLVMTEQGQTTVETVSFRKVRR